MFKKYSKKLLAVVCMVVLVFGMSNNVFSATAQSGSLSATVSGIKYTYYTQTTSGVLGVYGSCVVEAETSAPSGYMGAATYLYNANTSRLEQSSDTKYNTSSTKKYTNSTGRSTKSTTYETKGYVFLYKGNGYNQYTANTSPRLTYSMNNSEFEVNSHGETYGSDMYVESVEQEPDLIWAENEDGIIGYVYRTDLIPVFSTPEEAIAYTESHTEDYEIPMYDSEGTNIVGYFTITIE